MIYVGQAAIDAIEAIEGKLSPMECRIAIEEGFSDEVYEDSKGIATSGAGLTGEYQNMTFKEAVEAHLVRTRNRICNFDNLPEYMQIEFVQSEYRGDLGLSPTAVGLFNEGQELLAATEFLDHAEYKNPNTPKGIKARILSVATAMRRYGRDQLCRITN